MTLTTESLISCPFCGTSHLLTYGESVGFCRIECDECGTAAGFKVEGDGE